MKTYLIRIRGDNTYTVIIKLSPLWWPMLAEVIHLFYNFIDLQNNHMEIHNKIHNTCDFQQCGILTSVDTDKPVQPPVKLRNSK